MHLVNQHAEEREPDVIIVDRLRRTYAARPVPSLPAPFAPYVPSPEAPDDEALLPDTTKAILARVGSLSEPEITALAETSRANEQASLESWRVARRAINRAIGPDSDPVLDAAWRALERRLIGTSLDLAVELYAPVPPGDREVAAWLSMRDAVAATVVGDRLEPGMAESLMRPWTLVVDPA